MHRKLLSAFIATLAAALAMPALGQDLPKRKSGLWEIKLGHSNTRGKPGQRPGDTALPGGMTMNIYDLMDAKKK